MNLCPDYRNFKLSKLGDSEFKHLNLLFYWAIYGLFFLYFERIRVCEYHPVESFLDSYIPFVSLFIIPYFFWFIYLIGMLLYTLFLDVDCFRKYMWFVIITYSITSVIYFVYPTSQHLRPVIVDGNIFDKIVRGLYVFDTNTNVCPSIHVLGSFAVCFTALNCKRLSKPWIRAAFIICAVLISVSTVFLKQHSIIDLFVALLLSFLVYPLVFSDNKISRYLLRLF